VQNRARSVSHLFCRLKKPFFFFPPPPHNLNPLPVCTFSQSYHVHVLLKIAMNHFPLWKCLDPQMEEMGLFSMVKWDFNTFGLQQSILKSELFQGRQSLHLKLLSPNS
jgi:hypothetical protein